MKDQIIKMVHRTIENTVHKYLPENTQKDNWNLEGLRDYYRGWMLQDDELRYTADELENLEPDYVINLIDERAMTLYEQREQEFGAPLMRELERVVLLKKRGSQMDGPHRRHGGAEKGHPPARLRPA